MVSFGRPLVSLFKYVRLRLPLLLREVNATVMTIKSQPIKINHVVIIILKFIIIFVANIIIIFEICKFLMLNLCFNPYYLTTSTYLE